MYVVAIGIDRYRSWGRLQNAVGDARGALAAFRKLGFEEARAPLLDEAATGEALRHLVTDELRTLNENDSLVMFFAGHGHTVTKEFPGGTRTKKGYLVPVDGDHPDGRIGSWLSLKDWLGEIASLPPRHILVILDACHSGVALDPVIHWRGHPGISESLEILSKRRSRRIITSALDDQLALDSGPLTGHSLFTGCLIEALTGGLAPREGRSIVTGSEIGVHVQHRVTTYPDSKQTPDFGSLELDDRGELIFELPRPYDSTQVDTPPPRRSYDILPKRMLVPGSALEPVSVDGTQKRPAAGSSTILSKRASALPLGKPALAAPQSSTKLDATIGPPSAEGNNAVPAATEPPPPTTIRPIADAPSAPPPVAPGNLSPNSSSPPIVEPPILDAAFVAALGRHEIARRKAQVLSIVAADPVTALTGWATWAADRGLLTLVIKATTLDGAIEELLAQAPWLRSIHAARARLAIAAKLEESAIDAELDTRSPQDRKAWLDGIAGHDPHVRVSGWLLSALRDPWASPELTAAPIQGGELLSSLGALSAPISVLVHHPEPTAAWLERAIQTASELLAYLPRHPIAVGAPRELLTQVLRDAPESTGLAMARRSMVPLASYTPSQIGHQDRVKSLCAALAADPRTSNLFECSIRIPIHDAPGTVEVDLVARDALLAVEIDDWYHLRDPQSYRRDRIKDTWLQRTNFFVTRFLAEDVDRRLARVVDEIALSVGARRAAGLFAENPQ